MKFIPQGKKLLVQLPDREQMTEAGIIIPETAEMDKDDVKNLLGIVLEVGDKVEGIVSGDYVYPDPYFEYIGIKHPDTGKQCVFMTQDNILSVVKL